MEQIQRYYDEEYDEWERLARHRIEFDITKLYLNDYITGDNLNILDIGGGPGRYSIFLAEKGHRVTLLDLSKRNLETAKIKTAESGVFLEGFIQGNALDLSSIHQKFDVG
ncbi:class I SAM-dependent methyltransferase [Bacillus sp. EB01]|uniref:class I SAM-dependent methyltransferase n=1 Tax=Bacillus sp. EB01 TaxID=1347086 RepID=UPI000694D131|nr:methyltransferase domain-containing protein [Bacillus sp. EB01]